MSTVRSDGPSGVIRTRPFSVADYHRMVDAGILGEDDRVELLDVNRDPEPSNGRYRSVAVVRDSLSPVAIPGLALQLATIFD